MSDYWRESFMIKNGIIGGGPAEYNKVKSCYTIIMERIKERGRISDRKIKELMGEEINISEFKKNFCNKQNVISKINAKSFNVETINDLLDAVDAFNESARNDEDYRTIINVFIPFISALSNKTYEKEFEKPLKAYMEDIQNEFKEFSPSCRDVYYKIAYYIYNGNCDMVDEKIIDLVESLRLCYIKNHTQYRAIPITKQDIIDFFGYCKSKVAQYEKEIRELIGGDETYIKKAKGLLIDYDEIGTDDEYTDNEGGEFEDIDEEDENDEGEEFEGGVLKDWKRQKNGKYKNIKTGKIRSAKQMKVMRNIKNIKKNKKTKKTNKKTNSKGLIPGWRKTNKGYYKIDGKRKKDGSIRYFTQKQYNHIVQVKKNGGVKK